MNEDGPSIPDLLGHEAAEQAFLSAWNSGRLHHAWLITGPKGIGKATLARRIIRFLLTRAASADPGLFGNSLFGDALQGALPAASLDVDPSDPVLRRIAAGGHADLKILERGWTDERRTKMKSEIPVDDVRSVGAFLSLTPAEGGYRIVLVDSADEMNRSSANAILKLLEEPPNKALLLLISHSPGRLLPTIRSRCRRLVLRPLSSEMVVTLLGRYAPEIGAEDAHALALLSEGSIGRALALAEMGGLELNRELESLLSGLPRLDVMRLHAFGDKAAKSDDSFETFGALFQGWLSRAAAEAGRGETGLRAGLAAAVGLDRWVEVWEKTNRLFERADAVNLDRKQVVLDAFLTLERAVTP